MRELVEKEHAYPTSEGVYFAVDTFEDYGKLSGRTEADVEAGARVEVDEAKRNPARFRALEVRQGRRDLVGQPLGARTSRAGTSSAPQ